MRGLRVSLAGAAIVALATGLALSGCGGSPNSSTSGSSTASAKSGALFITKQNCRELQAFFESDLGRKVSAQPQATPPFSLCDLRIKEGLVVVYLDATPSIEGRYQSRVSILRKGASKPSLAPKPISGLGEPDGNLAGAYWSPQLHSAYAHRTSGWFTVFYPVEESGAERRAGAIRLLRKALEITE
jgi:hypothetical protein